VLLLDDAGEDVGVGRRGEISVQSRHIALGYWRRPDLTAEAFLADPSGGAERIYRTGDLGIRHPDGHLEHVGRKDLQVKVRGFRVETAEVEGALASLDAVREAAVVVQEDGPGEARLVAYVALAASPGPTVTALRRLLAERLPPHMVPSVFVPIERLPLMPSGKVDRRALPRPDRSRPALERLLVAPRTPVEAAVASIWREVLNLDAVGVHDPFVELGGHSLLAARIVTRLLEDFHLDLPPRLLLETDTVAGLATVVTQQLAESRERAAVERWLAEVERDPDGSGQPG
jgi:acyl carrier protein